MLTRKAQIYLMLATGVVVAGAASVYYPFSRAALTQRHLTEAHVHVVRLTPQLSNDPRFEAIHLSESARSGGVIQVTGTVSNAESLRQLRRVVESSQPPVDIVWSVQINGEHPGTRSAM